jgi:hypothetical protein
MRIYKHDIIMRNTSIFIVFIASFLNLYAQSERPPCEQYVFTELGHIKELKFRMGAERSTSLGIQAYKLSITNLSGMVISVSGNYYIITKCGNKIATPLVGIEIKPGQTLTGADGFAADMTGLTNSITTQECKGSPVAGCDGNNLIFSMGIENIKIDYPELTKNKKPIQTENEVAVLLEKQRIEQEKANQRKNIEEEKRKKQEEVKANEAKVAQQQRELEKQRQEQAEIARRNEERRIRNENYDRMKQSSDQGHAAVAAGFGTLALNNTKGFTNYPTNISAINLSGGMSYISVPLYENNRFRYNTQTPYTQSGSAFGAGFDYGAEYWFIRGPKQGISAFYRGNVGWGTYSSFLGGFNSFITSSNYGVTGLLGKKKLKILGELSFGGRKAVFSSDFDWINNDRKLGIGNSKSNFTRTGIGLMYDFSGRDDDDNESSVSLMYYKDAIESNNVSFESANVIKLGFRFYIFDFFVEYGRNYPLTGDLSYAIDQNAMKKENYLNLGFNTGITLFKSKKRKAFF